MILPLPLVPFEQYMLGDDYPAYPMTFFMRLHFSGRVDHEVLDSALQTVKIRHPLLSALVEKKGRKQFRWIKADGPGPIVQWLPLDIMNGGLHASYLDLRQEVGLRLWGLEAQNESKLVLQFHHSCCDGLGAFQFIGDLLIAYAQAKGENSKRAVLPPIDERLLVNRGKFGLTPSKFLRILPKQLVGLLGVRQCLMRSPDTLKPAALAPGEPVPANSHTPDAFPAHCSLSLETAELKKLRSISRQWNVTANDVLTRDLFLALGVWRTKHFGKKENRWLRLSMPMNLRNVGDRLMPAANIVSMVFLDRRPCDFAEPLELLKGIHDEMGLIKRLRLSLTFVLVLNVAQYFPGGLARITRPDRCEASCVLTNIGKPLLRVRLPRREGRIIAGNIVLEDLDVLAPIRPLTNASFALFEYAGKLNITLHYDPRALSAEQSADLLETFVRNVRESIQSIK